MKNIIQYEHTDNIAIPVSRPMPRSTMQENSIADVRAEIDSMFAADSAAKVQFAMIDEKPLTERTHAEMGNEQFYFICALILIFVLLGVILFDRILFNKTLLSFKKDVKDLARMRGDLAKLATNEKNNTNDEEKPQRKFTNTNVLVEAGELRRLRALERIYQDNIEGLIANKQTKEEKYLEGG